MSVTFRTYDPNQDFMRIRDFLIDTFSLYQRPFNWLIDRWNFCRYFVIPVHSYYNISYFGVPTHTGRTFRDELPGWEKTVGIWENEEGHIVGVVNSENEEPGEAWIQIHPDYTSLYDEMVTYIEAHLADSAGDIGYVKLYVNEGSELSQIARGRGYRRLEHGTTHLEYTIDELPVPQLPEGFVIKSVLDEDDVDRRRMAKAIAFGARYCPSDWPPAAAFEEMQQAPDYRKDLDLFIVAPNGDYASFCTIWIDEVNKYGKFEPVGTHAEYQRMGLGRALLMEGFRRMAQYGATRSFMDSGNEFYRKVGFRETPYSYYPWIKHFTRPDSPRLWIC
jgi:ribosomal protein S18 acetylase RimI-like enzyme